MMFVAVFLTLLSVVSFSSASCPSKCSCGQRNTPSRIVGGTDAGSNEFPWQASLQYTSGSHFCGGSLISSRWVVSAAHCTHGRSPSEVRVKLGEHNLEDSSAVEKSFTVSTIINHPSYNPNTIDNDISLLQLSSAVTFSKEISPVCLPFNQKTNIKTGDTTTVTGWGSLSSSIEYPDILQKVDVKYMDKTACKSAMGNSAGYILDSNICAMDQGKGACYGDSGGPFVKEIDGSYYLYGAVSWGLNCNYSQYPTVYAKVVNYLDWIKQKTGATDEFCTP